MSNELIEKNPREENAEVSLGDGKSVSMQVVQAVYNEITGKTEKLSKSYRINHQTTFEDVEQLNNKVIQLYEQYSIVENNCNITLYHIDDCKEQFSSFERFKIYDRSSLSPVENIRLQYNFLIALPKTDQIQSYTIEIDLYSRAAIKQRAENEHGVARRFMHLYATRTANLEIEYVDYTVARNFHVAIDQWFNSLNQSTSSKWIDRAQDYTHYYSFAFRYISALFICVYFYKKAFSIEPSALSLESAVLFLIVCFGVLYIATGVASRLGGNLARAIDGIQPSSFLKLNRGDEKSIEGIAKSNKKNAFKSIMNVILAVGINLACTYIAVKLGIGM